MKVEKNISVVNSTLLANYILERGGCMSHLKLQKILFYVQAFHLAYFDSEIISDEFEAWVHGPVSRKIFNELRDKSLIYAELSMPDGLQILPSVELEERVTADQLELVNDVIDDYKDIDGGKLEAITHSEQPWIDARKGYAPCEKCSVIISKEAITSFYKQYFS
ncbi:MAG: type II toxin-antitoxin system antitoxin SocA domain-containing protein [Rikenellaceae bacterium]